MKPFIHAKADEKNFKGSYLDYLPIHQMMDSSKQVVPNNLHRVLLHHGFGIFLMEKMFGIDFGSLNLLKEKHNLSDECLKDILRWKEKCRESGTSIKNSANREVQVRDIAESHCLRDFHGYIPSVQDYFKNLPLERWMCGKGKPDSMKLVLGDES